MNAVILAVLLMLGLSISRVPVVAAIVVSAIAAGLSSGMDLQATINSFEAGIGSGASTALSYAMLGAFAAAMAQSGIPQFLATKFLGASAGAGKWMLFFALGIAAVMSQNVIPIHIAFIPLVVPALLGMMTKLHIDRRAVACVMSFGLVTTYMILPVGFGGIYINEILLANIELAGLMVDGVNIFEAMWLPALGMCLGLLFALLVSYRDPRSYQFSNEHHTTQAADTISLKPLLVGALAVILAFTVQLYTSSMIIGALSGFAIFSLSGVLNWRAVDDTFIQGMRLMANIGFIMIAAAGFANVIQDTGEVTTLVDATANFVGGSAALGALLMLVVGLFVTMGIGSSFSTVPIIATLFVPLSLELGLSPLAIVALVGTAGALGDAGSPASDTTLGPTAGLNVDGQHDHIRDTVIPTFLHYNIPLLVFGWLAAMVLSA
ncbi:Na+/H+ antiporter NhaC family protein [uncultured Umboniibacter sp.]|uniref:Na+/H+ antiporter family protein n=1 Tax=uncultured Umboniibacter sp. TaxID=1798917 RepID=UPI0026359C2E|nr:Na+/H+ antiporter NhaC family protein [uncultured Umboniibacter sp.]